MREHVREARKFEGDVRVRPTRVFDEIESAYKSGFRIMSLQGSARSGKTFNTTIWYCMYAYNNARKRVAVVRQSMPRLRRTAFEDFREVMRMLTIWDPSRMNQQTMMYTFDNGSTVTFFATEDPGAAQGLKSDVLFVNEATEIEYHVWKQLLIRCTTFAILDYNPNFGDDHWICRLNREPSNVGKLRFMKTTYKDNPYLPQEQVDEIEALQYTDERLWRIYGLGEQSMVEGLVYDNVAIVDEIPERLMPKAIIGIDWGHTDPYAVTLVAIDERKREVYMDEVCYKSKMSTEEQIEVLRQPPCKGRKMICDSAAGGFIEDCKKAGLPVKKSRKSSAGSRSSIMPGITTMKSYKLFITRRSTNGIVESQNYTWKKDRSGEWLPEPIDKFNHFWDSVRYVVYTCGLGGLRQHRVGVKIR